TTAIQKLIDQKPADERWAIIINEYGQVSIDDALLENTGDVQIMELASGCVCCTMSYAFEPLLAQLIRRVKPDRIIIEPSGAGHPARIIDMLRNDNFGKVIKLGCTICIVDPADYDNPRIADSDLFHDQIQMSDAVVVSWTDKRHPEQVARCLQSLAQLDPPKSYIYQTSMGRLDLSWLDAEIVSTIVPIYHPNHSAANVVHEERSEDSTSLTTLQLLHQAVKSVKPRRLENSGNGHWACGWIWASHVCFQHDALMEALDSIGQVLRLKGIFHCDNDWWAVNRKGAESSLTSSSYRSDSRLEIIADQPTDWDAIETTLMSCIRTLR
ncbi:MAG: CobW family GTP-binding protein, partial [Pirellulales bacterium]